MDQNEIQEGKNAAIISYLWWIGLLIAFLMNNDKKNKFVFFHIRQAIGISILSFAVGIIARFSSTVGGILFLFIFVLWVIALIGAIRGEEKKIPLLGDQFQEWFKSIQ